MIIDKAGAFLVTEDALQEKTEQNFGVLKRHVRREEQTLGQTEPFELCIPRLLPFFLETVLVKGLPCSTYAGLDVKSL
jgi:hypothetical protein